MKHLLFFLLISTSIFAQDFSVIKAKTDAYSGLLTSEKLAANIKRDFSSDEDKVKAIFCWMTRNIRYDLEEFYNPNRQKTYSFRYRTQEEFNQKQQELKDKTVTQTLTSRKAVCEGYAQTFSKICNLLNIENNVVTGYVRHSYNNINKPEFQPNHAWNVVKVNNKWMFIDTTWASGYEINGRWLRKFNPYYYDMNTATFFKTHYPENSKWRLQIGRMEKEAFYKQPIYSNSFLTSKIKLLKPTSGTLYKKDGKIEIQLKNHIPTQEIHVGFLGMQFAQKPEVTIKKEVTFISFFPPSNAKQLFLLIDKQVVLEFLVQ